jgi:hypothetical protein
MKGALAVAIFCLAALTSTPTTLAQMEPPTPQHAFVPFTLVTGNYSYDSTSDPGPRSQVTIARRSDGATVTLYSSRRNGELTAVPFYRHLQFLDGREAYVYDAIHAFVKWPTVPRAFQMHLLYPAKNCVYGSEIFEKSATLDGLQVTVIRQMLRFGGVRIEWRAPELACQTLESTFERSQTDGSLRVQTEERFVSVKLGEPDPSLFSIPAGYPSLKPSIALHELWQCEGRPSTEHMQDLTTQMDISFASREEESGPAAR